MHSADKHGEGTHDPRCGKAHYANVAVPTEARAIWMTFVDVVWGSYWPWRTDGGSWLYHACILRRMPGWWIWLNMSARCYGWRCARWFRLACLETALVAMDGSPSSLDEIMSDYRASLSRVSPYSRYINRGRAVSTSCYNRLFSPWPNSPKPKYYRLTN